MADEHASLTLLWKGMDQLALQPSEKQKGQLERYIHEIALFNRSYHLVAATMEDFVVKHLLDCLAAVPVFKRLIKRFDQPPRLCDVGSGAGLPGIILAIMLDGLAVSLVERSGRRAGFLRNAVALCNLGERVAVLEEDLKQVTSRYELVTLRAFHPLPVTIEDLSAILADGALICAYKGRIEVVHKELSEIDRLVAQAKGGNAEGWDWWIEPLVVPFLDAPRHLCVMQKKAHGTGMRSS